MNSPACPCCGRTSARKVQRIPGKLLSVLWRVQFGVKNLRVESPTLYECECGLRFFSPAREGDANFYREAYSHRILRGWLSRPGNDRADFLEAASFVKSGDRVLDVGGNKTVFSSLLPEEAICTVIDPLASEYGADHSVLRETAAEHAENSGECYDVACAFHVLEHVEKPVALAEDILRCLKPGGLLIFATPTWPSCMTEIPNMAINAPPHHMTWWSPKAFAELAKVLGLEFIQARVVTGTPALQKLWFWLWKLTPHMPPDRPYCHSWGVHFRLALAALLKPLLNLLPMTERQKAFTDVVFVARKPVRDLPEVG